MTCCPVPSDTVTVRPRCSQCQRPVELCLCHLLPGLCSRTRVLVIQHPDERHHALNTARLLVAGLTSAQLLVADRVPTEWQAQLNDPAWNTELLFPGPQAPVLAPAVEDLRPRRLVLLDGTWRKARKLLYLNPVLRQLPQVALPPGLVSRYRLRKAPASGALSTIEAAVSALRLIEPDADFSPLLRPFDALIEGQIRAMGQALYARNYSKPSS